MLANVNWFALILAAVASFVVGMLWYSPLLFGKPWQKLMGMTGEKSFGPRMPGMGKIFATNFILDILTGLALYSLGAAACLPAQLSTMSDVAQNLNFNTTWSCFNLFVLFAWLGFTVPILAGSVLWESKPWKLFWINASFRLVSLLVMAGVIARFAF